MVKQYLLPALMLLSACTSPQPDGVSPPPYSTDNFLKATAFSSNILQPETRFISYSKNAKRVSIIDPQQEVEVWGKSAPGFDFAVALPDYLGGSLFADDRVVVMVGDAQKSFSVHQSYAYVASAANAVAYGLASVDGRSIEIIRSLGAGQWQQETLPVPWGAVDPIYTSAPAGQPILLVTHYNDDGTKLAAFAPADGRYAVFEAASPADNIQNTSNWCAGDGVGTVTNATFISLAWDEAMQTYYTGDVNGRIYAIDPFGGCISVAALNQIAMPDSTKITQINLFSPGRLGVIQDEAGRPGKLSIVDYDGSGFTIEPIVFNNVCDVLLGAMILSSDYLAVMCSAESDLQAPPDGSTYPKDIRLEPRGYVLYDVITGKIVNNSTIDKQLTSGMAVDPVTATAYRMLDGGFGNLQIINLITGETRTTVGLFINGILN